MNEVSPVKNQSPKKTSKVFAEYKIEEKRIRKYAFTIPMPPRPRILPKSIEKWIERLGDKIDLDDSLYPHDLDWTFGKPSHEKYAVVYIIEKEDGEPKCHFCCGKDDVGYSGCANYEHVLICKHCDIDGDSYTGWDKCCN